MKSQIRSWLACADFEKIVDAALKRDRTLGLLVSLTYDSDPLICWRAVDAIGRCARRLSATRAESLKSFLRRLFWTMSDESGSIAWHAPEAIGEIIRSDPQAFSDFIPMALSMLDLEPEDRPPFLPGILYALGRIGEVVPDSVDSRMPAILEALAESDPQTRAMAVVCLGRLRAKDLLCRRPHLAHDRGKALVYRDEQLVETTIGALLSDIGIC